MCVWNVYHAFKGGRRSDGVLLLIIYSGRATAHVVPIVFCEVRYRWALFSRV